MSSEASTRRILPQSSHVQSFTSTPTQFPLQANQKNYVFVDEHNRHKRLKVMRACEGCRRRKIRCDAATTNTWPCSACIRLKLHCVPPTVQYDGGTGHGFEPERVDYESGSGDDDYQAHTVPQDSSGPLKPPTPLYPQQIPYSDGLPMYHSIQYSQPPSVQPTMQYSSIDGGSVIDDHYSSQSIYPAPSILQHHSQSLEGYQHEQYGTQDLADLLGDLKMDPAGLAPYLDSKKKKDLPEEPAFEDVDDYKHVLPPLTSPDLKIRIPPELMPDDHTAMHYFDLYFANVHPYVPVLNKAQFYQQWHNSRDSISPLILEAIFAIAGQLADEPSQGQQWLAVVGRHAESFMDVPRLSTIQAMLIVLKARESAPKRGYYYRSWMSVVQCIAMAKDLSLDEHFDDHKVGKPCGSSHADCLTKTRIWQALFVIELMIGTSQGRIDLAVDIGTVDFSIPRPGQGDDSEFHVSRGFTYFARAVRNVSEMNIVYGKIKNKKDWGLDPELVQLNPLFPLWLSELPSDQQLTFPTDGSLPWLPSHFVANMHTYYYLSIILLHRPQLTFMDPSGADGGWKHHMMICYSSAKALCKLHESLLQQYGLHGLLCMQRGVSFAIYCVLTCTVLHLVALTSPDPDLNAESRDYFSRNMLILEKCTNSWPMPEIKNQIEALREAFSADTRRPFVLKPSIPFGSPTSPSQASPPRVIQYQHQPELTRSPSMDEQSLEQHHMQQSQVGYTSHPITPPVSAGGMESKGDSPAVQSLVMMATGQRFPQQQHQTHPTQIANTVSMVDPSTWNPSRIFDQWNTSFGTPVSSSNAGNLSPLQTQASTGPGGVNDLQSYDNGGLYLPPASQALAPQHYSNTSMPTFISPSMWQESVASVYEGGLKRHWDFDGNSMSSHLMKRAR